jgi:hypothetical protein
MAQRASGRITDVDAWHLSLIARARQRSHPVIIDAARASS